MPIVKLNIDDKEFKIECADGEENLLRKAESKLNSEIKSHPEFKNLSDSKKYLMISLIIASKENTNIKENNNINYELIEIDNELKKLESFFIKNYYGNK